MPEAREEKTPDWEIHKLYAKAWEIVKTNKILWIFGAAVAAGSSSNNISFDVGDLEGLQKMFNGPSSTSEVSRVLGETTSATGEIGTYLFSTIPPSFYLILAIESIALFLFSIVVACIYQSWATGALLANIKICIHGGKARIRDASEKAFGFIKSLLFVQLVPPIIFVLTCVLSLAGLMVLFAITPESIRILFLLIFFVYVVFFIYAVFMLSFTLIWAQRQVVDANQSARQALRAGYFMAKKKKWSMLLLGLINNILAAFILTVPIIALIAVPVIVGIVLLANPEALNTFMPIIIVLGSLGLLAFIVIITVGSAIITAFKATVWSLAFTAIKEKYEQP